MGIFVILVLAYAIAKTITNYRIDREYAQQGLESPRLRAKATRSESAAARARPGAKGYFQELWNDAWDDAAERHRARRAAKRSGTAPPERHRKSLWRWLLEPIGEGRPEQMPPPAAVPVSPAPTPTPPTQVPGPPRPAPTPAARPPAASRRESPPPLVPTRSEQTDNPAPSGRECPHCGGWIHPPTSPCPSCGPLLTRPPQTDQPDQGEDMATNTATGDAYDVESCDRELDVLTDDLTAIDTALDVIDEKVREARTSTEHIQAFLAGKNVDGTVLAGLATALDMLGPDAIKTLIDAIDGAKQGVAATKDAMGPLREASELVGAADGSVLNGR